ncbi:MAG: HAD hydrolase family protein [Candidatus Levybacteria bacterium]|nr:HAD hydrolase family protein [Candidatus Levybacteria bacterium]
MTESNSEIGLAAHKEVENPVYKGSVIEGMKKKQLEEGRAFTALFTDIDNTFVADGKNDASSKLWNSALEGNFPVVAVTGNGLADVQARIASGELPYFSAIASCVGTEIWVLNGDGTDRRYLQDNAFAQEVASHGYDRKAIAALGAALIEEMSVTSPASGFVFQQPEQEEALLLGQGRQVQPYKTSFYFLSSQDAYDGLVSSIRDQFSGQKVVICEEIGHNSKIQPGEAKKYCVDVLPVTKSDAVNYLKSSLDIDIAVVAGDSGNDTEMLEGSGDVSILVGGARDEAVAAISEEAGSGSGKGSFRRVGDKLYYQEASERVGPESIIHAAEILRRAQRRFGK